MRLGSPKIVQVAIALMWLADVAGTSASAGDCPPQYEVSAVIVGPDCGIFGPAPVTANAMSNTGIVVGRYDQCAEGSFKESFYWTKETGVVKIPRPAPYYTSEAFDVSDSGYVCGTMVATNPSKYRAYRFHIPTGELVFLEPPRGWLASEATCVSGKGVVAGYAYASGSSNWKGFVWNGKSMQIVDPPYGDHAQFFALNDSGMIAGRSFNSTGDGHLIFWQDGTATDFGIAPDWTGLSDDFDLSDAGDIVGTLRQSDPTKRHAFRWTNKKWVDLGTLENTTRSRAVSVAEDYWVVGQCTTPGAVPTLWIDENAYDLKQLLITPQVSFTSAVAINEQKQILVNGQLSGEHGALMFDIVKGDFGDLNCDGEVNDADLVILLDQWGAKADSGDLNDDGQVDGADLGLLLGSWSQ